MLHTRWWLSPGTTSRPFMNPGMSWVYQGVRHRRVRALRLTAIRTQARSQGAQGAVASLKGVPGGHTNDTFDHIDETACTCTKTMCSQHFS